jgi:hypothetical protein
LKAWADVWRYASDVTRILRYKIGQRTWHEGPIPGRERFLIEKLLKPGSSPVIDEARWRDFKELAASARRGEVVPVPVRRPYRGPAVLVYWHGKMPLTQASVVRIEFEYPLPARGEARRCQGEWNERTLTATGCENIAAGRFERKGKDLRAHHVWLCARCSVGPGPRSAGSLGRAR